MMPVWRTHSCVPRSHSCERQIFHHSMCSHECEHGMHECVRHRRYKNSMRSLRAEYSISFSSRFTRVSSFFALATHPAVMRR